MNTDQIIKHGLLINFGFYKFFIQKFAKSERAPKLSPSAKTLLTSLFAFLAFFRG